MNNSTTLDTSHLTTSNIKLRKLTLKDAEFILQLMNDPDCLRYIGDRGIKNIEDAQKYIQQGPQKMYQQDAIGLLVVESLVDGNAMGLCGLLKRPELPIPDLGFALLPAYRKQGVISAAAQLVLNDAAKRKVTPKVLALTSLDNEKSINLLGHFGFVFKEIVDLKNNGDKTKLFELPLNF
ncbi:GNAT family N-acetyltransferase [uncultured Paraglaciecola sp.]|uniref:GNAT family N-acetyltransferase n=1 Tax=uncultured Paraglaciecola sp. TaxID=1765024 RepID=UPI002631F42D|nr:GNAT family N-acetyltransferase [uncultured Paraglaciecola sp.]